MKRPPRPSARRWMIATAIFAGTFALFSAARHNDFVSYDDPYYVAENANVAAGLSMDGVRWAFSTFEDGNWFPLTWLSHMTDVSLWGLDAGAHHLVNAGLHALAAAALFLVLGALGIPSFASVLAVALFAVHPLRVESVAWAAERKDVLSSLLAICTIGAYVRWVRHPSRGRFAWLVVVFAAALMAKAMPMTLPFVLLLIDYWPLQRWPAESWRQLVREKAVLFAMAIAAGVIAIAAQSGAGATATLTAVSPAARLSNAAVSYVAYLGDIIWPADLAVFYPRTPVSILAAAVAVVLLAGISLLAWRQRSARPYLIVGWLWYLGMLLPVIGLLQIGSQARADRYTYLPMIGLCLAVACLVESIARQSRTRQIVAFTGASVICAVLADATLQQIRTWRDSVTLFEHARTVTPPNYTTISNLANALRRAGFDDRALAEFREAVRLAPRSAEAHTSLGAALARQGRLEEATEALQTAVRLTSDNYDAHYNLAHVFMRTGRMTDAIVHMTQAVRLNGSDARLRSDLGAALATVRRYDEAIEQFEAALRLDPSLDETRRNLSYARQLRASGKGGN